MEYAELDKEKVARLLKSEGLGAYEIKAYLTLLRYGSLSEIDVSKRSRGVIDDKEIPQPKVYGVLKSLSKKGYVFRSLDKKHYRPHDPSRLFDTRVDELKKMKDSLRDIYQDGQEAGTVNSEEATEEELGDEEQILERIREIVSSSNTGITVLGGDLSWLEQKRYSLLVENIAAAMGRGVKITIICDRGTVARKGIENENTKKLQESGVKFIQIPAVYSGNRVKIIVGDKRYTIRIVPTISSVARIPREQIRYIGKYIESEEVALFYNMVMELLIKNASPNVRNANKRN